MTLLRLAAVSLALTLVACKTTTSGANFEPEPLTKPVTFGVTRPISERSASFSANKLSFLLSQRLGVNVPVQVFDDEMQLADALAAKKIDAAWMPPGAYVRATSKDGDVHPLFKLLRDGNGSYRSVLFTKVGKVTPLTLFKGKTLVLAGSESMSGRLLPLAYLKKQGIDPDAFFGKILTVKDHRQVCETVLSGEADLGATLSDNQGHGPATIDGCRAAGLDPAKFAAVEMTESVPNDVIAVRPDSDPNVVYKLKEVFSTLPTTDGGRMAMKEIFHADGFELASDDEFTGIRQLKLFVTQ